MKMPLATARDERRKLRARAENCIGSHKLESGRNGTKTVHELRVHEIELEMQNNELRRAQQELQEVCDRYEELYDFAPCAYLTLDEKGGILEANLAASTLLGVDRRALRGQKFTRYICDQSQDAFYFFIRLLLSTEKWKRTELDLKSRSHNRLTVRVDAMTRFRNEIAIGVRIGLTDITEARQAEQQVQANEKVLHDFFENAPIGIQWLGMDGTILKANRAQLEMLGYSQEEYVGRKFSEFEVENMLTRELADHTRSQNILNNFRTQLRHRDGSVRSVVIDANARWLEKKFLHFSVFTRDKLDQEILAISEREQRRIAQDLHDNLGQILAAALHLGVALQKKLKRGSRPEAEDEACIVDLVHQALAETRSMARGLHPVRPETNGLMAALEELAMRTLKHFRTPCVFQCPADVLLEDDNVATHLYRIAQEAVTNAVKHGKARRIIITLLQENNLVTLKVEDHGRGFSKRRGVQPGMGMRIMRYRADLIDATLDIQNAPRAGTVVTCSATPSTKQRIVVTRSQK